MAIVSNRFDKITDPSKLPGSFTFNPENLDDEELQYFINAKRNALDRTLPRDAAPGQFQLRERDQGILQRLEGEMNKRQSGVAANKQQQQLMDLLGGGGVGGRGGVGGSSTFNQDAYLAEQQAAAGKERGAIEDIFKTITPQQTDALNEVFNKQRGQALEEAAAAGNLRQPAFMSSVLGNMDAQRGRAMSELFSNLGSKRAEALAGVEERLGAAGGRGREFAATMGQNESQFGRNLEQTRRQNLANLIQGGNQFSQSFGLERDKFGEAKYRGALDDIFNRESLGQAERLGRAQAEASKPSALSEISGLLGGIGSLAGGVGSLRRPRKAVM